MGIKSLLKFLENYDTSIINKIDDNNLKFKKIAIDISILLYQVIIAIRNSGSDLTNQQGEITSHILGLFNKTIFLLKKNIIPIYVFDGKPPALKNKILDIRRNIKKKSYIKYKNSITVDDKIKYFKRTVTITKKQIDETKELLDTMGIPYIYAPEEADSQCSYLAKNGFVDGVLTEDMDILTFGSPVIYRNLSSYKKPTIEIRLDNILSKLQLTREQFIEFCILLGCDYNDNIKGVNSKDMYSYYIQFKNIPETLTYLKSKGINTNNFKNYDTIKKYFKDTANVNKNIPILELQKPDINKLEDILVNKYGLLKDKLYKKLIFLKKNNTN
uniref:XPG I-region protein n=1 Tax=Megaviridae environmental sample TaxID=1737588 RepID=A0A5J6VJP9_9VIRU|nr:MAG: XPG I-region protein [Megaviridae environmental sample]